MSDVRSSVCVVDDDLSSREAIVSLIRSDGFAVRGFASADEFLADPVRDAVDCLVLDVVMPGLGGLGLQKRLTAGARVPPIIFVTGHGDIPTSVSAIKAGAVDFLTKPLDDQALLDAVHSAVASRPVDRARATAHPGQAGARASKGSEPRRGTSIVYASTKLARVLDQVRSVAPTDTTVLIQGETGTGKECIARALHEASRRSDGPFVQVNCAAIPAGLLESELMGHERGAFTGAIHRRIGRFELARNGTIFLDEVGELPLELQPKLLRLLQEREFERVGGSETIRSNARVIAATNCDLGQMVRARTFREDLFYRLDVFPIVVPPLRERKRDIPVLANHFAELFAKRMGRPVRRLEPHVLERLVAYSWPGNIRELQNVIERAMILSRDETIDLPPLDPPRETFPSDALADVNRAHILHVLRETNWVVAGPSGAAARLQMKRSTLNYRMKQLGIARPSAKKEA